MIILLAYNTLAALSVFQGNQGDVILMEAGTSGK